MAAAPAPSRHLLFASTSYPRDAADWQGVFMRHLAFALARAGDTTLSVWAPPGDLPPGAASALQADDADWLRRLAEAGGIARQLRRLRPAAVLRPLDLLRRLRRACRATPADAYFVNWLQNALALPRDGKPAIVTALGTDMALLRLPGMVPLLRHAFAARPCVLCPNADWMVAPLAAAFGDVAKVQAVPFGIDPRWFAIQRTPPARPRWLAVARLTPDKLGPLLRWGEPLFAGQDRELHLIGPNQAGVALPDWVHFHGPASAEALATRWFPEATGLVTLSRHAEGLPQVVLEAMAAGLPVVASPLPAHRGVVRPGDTGWLVESFEGFAAALAEAEAPEANRRAGEAGRRLVRERMGTWDDCALRYLSLLPPPESRVHA